MKVLYIILTDINNNNLNSGPTVRSMTIKKELEKKYKQIDIIQGANAKERFEIFKQLKKENADYDYCYIESRVGVTRWKDTKILRSLKDLKIKKIALYYRDMYWAFNIKTSKGTLKNLLVPFINKHYVRFLNDVCDVIFVQSESFKNELLQFIPKSTINLLPPGCDDIDEPLLVKKGALYVGEVDERFSGIELLLETFKHINEHQDQAILNIVCRKEEYDKNTKLINMNEEYQWLSIFHCSKETIKEVYDKSSITIIPRNGEEYTKLCLPIKLFEYISFEKPIVSIDHGEVGKFIEENKVGITTKGTKEDFSEKILDLLKDEDTFNFYKEKIKEYKKTNMWSNRIELIHSILKED
ncbi:hypothetical protein CKN73_02540 [Carnobacterium divergens]|uniref:glycosyltransferase n=1 Tax=Carnobacterium divergens TaxID=2748 RepID=UPI00107236E2|nr:glycosyltransferase [Carnobacterium divergens]TFJ44433.1 hypothetical protein CKN77_02515 [Carnobacterium divergens]TFJ52406.1 hypothetical protein CKN73_02540 [Carnobacterium divergens]TFJ57571.1 hypothetical protein CKN83_02530 [Carnobacterium divergens]TFJ65997.1 hypothetical protein CKN89_02540 [Carnobacterium divergens]TFJ74302.1 hypothetical protein CKN91_02535 [Carnobacterium divergens]